MNIQPIASVYIMLSTKKENGRLVKTVPGWLLMGISNSDVNSSFPVKSKPLPYLLLWIILEHLGLWNNI